MNENTIKEVIKETCEAATAAVFDQPGVADEFRRLYNGNPTPEEQAKAAHACMAAYDAIVEMCGEDKACPAPFDEIYRLLLRHLFTLGRLK